MADTPTKTSAIERLAGTRSGLGQAIGLMAEDKSNDWRDEIEDLESVEKAIDETLVETRELTEMLKLAGGPEQAQRFLRLGRYTAVLLGSNSEWDSGQFTDWMSSAWLELGGKPIGGSEPADVKCWRELADELGIEHDGRRCDADGCTTVLLDDSEFTTDTRTAQGPYCSVHEIACAEPSCEEFLVDAPGDATHCTAHVTEETQAADEHAPTYVPSSTAPNLVQTFCRCGRSSFGASMPESAAETHLRHRAYPDSDTYRDVEATNRLLALTGLEIPNRRSTS